MIALSAIEEALRAQRDFAVFDHAYLHRATLEDALGLCKGRAAVRAARIAACADETAGPVRVVADLGDMIVFETVQGWRGHRWVRREGERILEEVEVLDGAARAAALGNADQAALARRIGAAHPIHPPLGELRAGQGQLAVPDAPLLPPDFPSAAADVAGVLHRIWNGRALGEIAPAWRGPAEAGEDPAGFMLRLFALLPDATWLVERAIVDGDRIALLWRLFGHYANGRRVRAIGSSVVQVAAGGIASEEMMIDTLLIEAARCRPAIDLGDGG